MRGGTTFSCIALAAAFSGPLAAQTGAAVEAPIVQEEDLRPFDLEPFAPEPEESGPARTTIVPWEVQVLGKNFDGFPNDEASIVLTDWLVNSLIDLNVFNVVNRDRIQAVLSEQQLGSINNSSLASAGRLLSVDYILIGNFKNLGQNIELDFKLLDVATTTYKHPVKDTTTFNPDIESMKPEIDRIVARLAAHFPVLAKIDEILDERRLVIGAGGKDGITDAMEAELWRAGGAAAEMTGYVIGTTESRAEVLLDAPVRGVDLFDHVVQVKIVPPAQAALKKGQGLFATARFQEALDTFEIGLEADPEDGLLHAFKARSHWKLGAYEAAVASFRRALALRPDDVGLLEDAVTSMLESGHSEEVVELLDADQRLAYSGALELSYGMAHESLGELDRAREAYRSVLRREPNNAAPHLRLGVLAALNKDREATSREFSLARGTVANPLELDMAIAALAVVHDPGGAAKSSLETLAERADGERNLTALTTASEVVLLDPGQWELSLTMARRAFAINPRYVRAGIAAARAHAAGGQRAEAIARLNEALASYPNNAALLLLSGDLLVEEGDLNEARMRYQRAAEQSAADWRPDLALGELYTLQVDHLRAARSYLAALEKAKSSDTADLIELSYKVGSSAALAEQFDLAQPHLEFCVERAPDHVDCQFFLGQCYFSANTEQSDGQAIEALSAALSIPESAYYLGVLHERKGLFDDAVNWHRKCVEDDCSRRGESEKRLDVLETLTGTVTKVQPTKPVEASLDIGRLHGIVHGQEGVLVQGSRVEGRVRVEEVREDTSVVQVFKGEPRVGYTVRFRPARPKGVRVVEHSKKGVIVRWSLDRAPEIDFYEVLSGPGPRGPWRQVRKVKPPKNEAEVKTVKPGETVYFRVIAVSDTGAKSVPSLAAWGVE
ncbi:MAG: tetratricopeptide repeat protein [Myxococcales bacterium]|nr:tetratricopeptide repeat protein [Myxococcales bacterium]